MVWMFVAAGVLLLGAILLWAWQPLRRFGGEVQLERAQELFILQSERLQPKFLSAAAATGKPRGLRWKDCVFEGDVEFGRERKTRQLVALVPVTIQFEAVEGGDMEGVPAVANPRNASAVFYFQAGQWETIGKAVFNMNPGEAIAHFGNQYEPVGEKQQLKVKNER